MTGTRTPTTTAAPALGRTVRANLSTAELYEYAIRAGEGLVAADGPLVVRTGKHTGRSPEDKFIVEEPSSRDKIWWGPVNRPISEANYDRLRARLVAYLDDKVVYAPGLLHRRRARAPAQPARLHGDGLGEHLRAEPVPPPVAAGPGRALPRTSRSSTCRVQGRPGDRGHPDRDRDPGPPATDGDHHRRDRVRRRDQEVGLHGDELPDARRGRPADALRGQRRAGRRLGRLLRPERDGQDDPVGRSAAQPDRRRRARLGRRRRVQLRGRLLRQDDPPVADVRARHLPDDAAVRDDPRERRPRPADPRSSTSTPNASPRTPAARTRSSSSATPTRPGSPASPATSSC